MVGSEVWTDSEWKMAEETEKPAGVPAVPVSFSFSRTSGRKRFLHITGQDGREAKQEPDFLSAVEGKELQRCGFGGGRLRGGGEVVRFGLSREDLSCGGGFVSGLGGLCRKPFASCWG